MPLNNKTFETVISTDTFKQWADKCNELINEINVSEIPTIDGGKAKIKIPDGTQNGKQFRLKGKGMPYMRGSGNGDLYVQVNTEVPISLNKEQKELLEKFREIENEKSNPSIKKFFQKAKSFWKN